MRLSEPYVLKLCLQDFWKTLVSQFPKNGVFQKAPEPLPIVLNPRFPVRLDIIEVDAVLSEHSY